MNDTCRVGLGQRACDLDGIAKGCAKVAAVVAADPLIEGFSFDKLHDQVVDAGFGTYVVDLHDMGIVERRRGPRFLGKALMFGFADSLGTEHFESYVPVEVEIASLVDHTHSAFA